VSSEEQFAQQLCRALDQRTSALDPVVTERLRAARMRALERQTVTATDTQIIGAGGTASLMQAGHDGAGHPWRTLFVILAMIIGMSVAYYWNSFDEADANEEIDSALLADELPPKAYLDPGFQAWLSHYAQESAR
jgi:hypothetical protein